MKVWIDKALKANGLNGEVDKIEGEIKRRLENGNGIWVQLEKGFCFAYLEGRELVVWQMYNEGGDQDDHKEVFGKLKEFAKGKADKMIMNVNGSRYKAALRLYGDMNPIIRMVQLEVSLKGEG